MNPEKISLPEPVAWFILTDDGHPRIWFRQKMDMLEWCESTGTPVEKIVPLHTAAQLAAAVEADRKGREQCSGGVVVTDAMVWAAVCAWRDVYEAEYMQSGSTMGNDEEAMKAALRAALQSALSGGEGVK